MRSEVAHVAQCRARSGFALRQRKRVEEKRGEVILQGAGEALPKGVALGMKVRVEEFFRHGRCDAATPARGKRAKNRGDVEVALVIWREHHGGLHAVEILHADNGNAREQTSERQ